MLHLASQKDERTATLSLAATAPGAEFLRPGRTCEPGGPFHDSLLIRSPAPGHGLAPRSCAVEDTRHGERRARRRTKRNGRPVNSGPKIADRDSVSMFRTSPRCPPSEGDTEIPAELTSIRDDSHKTSSPWRRLNSSSSHQILRRRALQSRNASCESSPVRVVEPVFASSGKAIKEAFLKEHGSMESLAIKRRPPVESPPGCRHGPRVTAILPHAGKSHREITRGDGNKFDSRFSSRQGGNSSWKENPVTPCGPLFHGVQNERWARLRLKIGICEDRSSSVLCTRAVLRRPSVWLVMLHNEGCFRAAGPPEYPSGVGGPGPTPPIVVPPTPDGYSGGRPREPSMSQVLW